MPYRATSAHALAYERASRAKPSKLHMNAVLRAKVEEDLKKKYSPEQIAGRLRVEFPDEPEMQKRYRQFLVENRPQGPQLGFRWMRSGWCVREPSTEPFHIR